MTKERQELIEKISNRLRDRGDIELVMKFDRVIDRETEAERGAALGAVVKELSAPRK